MKTIWLTAAVGLMLAAPLAARQVPTKPGEYPVQPPVPLAPEKSVHPECYRPDVAANMAGINKALAENKGAETKDPEQVQKRVAGCVFYKVTMVSRITVEDTEVPGVSSTIKGQGSITFGLAPDNAEAGYDFTSGVQDLPAPFYWEKGSALITRPDCIVTTVEQHHTQFAFWLGVTNAPTLKVGVRIAPDGDELHNVATRCKDSMGRWHDGPPGEKAAIFSPGWIALHGEGRNKAPVSADQRAVDKSLNDMGKGKTPVMPKVSSPTGAMDMGKLQAMQDYMAKNPNAGPAEMMKMMGGVVPDLDQQLEAAQDNFMFKAPGECAAVNAVKVVCNLPSKPFTTTSRAGFGTFKKITENTVITIEKVSAPVGG